MSAEINKNTLEGSWNELKGKVKQQWSKLTEDDLGTIKGSVTELTGRLQKVYGYTKEKALEEFEDFKKAHMSHKTENEPTKDKPYESKFDEKAKQRLDNESLPH